MLQIFKNHKKLTIILGVVILYILFASIVYINKQTNRSVQKVQITQKNSSNTNSKQSQASLEEIEKAKKEAINQTIKLIQLNQDYKKNTGEKNAILTELRNQAQIRKKSLIHLIDKAPESFLKIAISKELKQDFPPEINIDLEEKTQVFGSINKLHIDNFQNNSSHDLYSIKTNENNNLEVVLVNNNLSLENNDNVSIQGTKIDNVLVAEQIINSKQASLSKTSNVLGIKTPQKVAVVLVNFFDNLPLFEPDFIKRVMFTNPDSVKQYYLENTYNRLSLEGDVYGWYKLDTGSSCVMIPYVALGTRQYFEDTIRGWTNKANIMAQTQGIDLENNFDKLVYIFTMPEGCALQGGVQLSEQKTAVFMSQLGNLIGDFSTKAIVHELGHSYNATHANSLLCFSPIDNSQTPISSNCTTQEYGDPFDVMGLESLYQMSTSNKIPTKALDLSSQVIQGVETSGTYYLSPNETLDSGYKIIGVSAGKGRIRISRIYDLEYRQPYGIFDNFESSDPVVNGISIRRSNPRTGIRELIDTTTEDDGRYFGDAALGVGKSFYDPEAGLKITTVSVNPSYAAVKIEFDQTITCETAPTIQISPLSQEGGSGLPKEYTLSIINNNPSNCVPSQFNINVQNQNNLSVNLSAGSVTIASGSTSYVTASVAPIAEVPGSYDFTLEVKSQKNPSNSAIISATYNQYTSTEAAASANLNALILDPNAPPSDPEKAAQTCLSDPSCVAICKSADPGALKDICEIVNKKLSISQTQAQSGQTPSDSSQITSTNVCISFDKEEPDICYVGKAEGPDCNIDPSVTEKLTHGCKNANICIYTDPRFLDEDGKYKCYVGRCTSDKCTTGSFNVACSYDNGLGQEINCPNITQTTTQLSTLPQTSTQGIKEIEVYATVKVGNNYEIRGEKVTKSGPGTYDFPLTDVNPGEIVRICVEYSDLQTICTGEYKYSPLQE